MTVTPASHDLSQRAALMALRLQERLNPTSLEVSSTTPAVLKFLTMPWKGR
jgi:hypothetical protein